MYKTSLLQSSCIVATAASLISHASPALCDVIYSESFTPGTRSALDVTDAIEVDNSASGPHSFAASANINPFSFGVGTNDSTNAGASSGTLSFSHGGGATGNLLVPLVSELTSSNTITMSLDIDPSTALADGTNNNSVFWGIILTQNQNTNFYAANGNLRIGIRRNASGSGASGGYYLVATERGSGGSTSVTALGALDLEAWHTLEIEWDLAAKTFDVALDGTHTLSAYEANLGATFTHVGIETITDNSANNDAATTSHFDNFTVSNVIPEPGSLSFAALGVSMLLRRRTVASK